MSLISPKRFALLIRPDGRPEAYDLPIEVEGAPCEACAAEGHTARLPRGKVVMASPVDMVDGLPHCMCIERHVPDNIVIFDPATGFCRDKSGDNVWRE
jgi:hypothetical protein